MPRTLKAKKVLQPAKRGRKPITKPEPKKIISDDEITTPEIEEIKEKLKQKLKPSEKMRLARQKREAIKKEKIRLGIYEESESEIDSDSDDDIDMEQLNNDLDHFNNDMNVSNNKEFNIDVNGANNNIGDAVQTLVKNSLDMQKNPQNKKANMNNIMTSVNQILEGVMSNIGGNKPLTDAANNKVNIYVKNGPNDEPKVIESFDFSKMDGFNSDFNDNFKNFMQDEPNKDDSDTEDEIEIVKPEPKKESVMDKKKPNIKSKKTTPKPRGRKKKEEPKQIEYKEHVVDNEQNNDQKIHDKAKTYTNYKNNMLNYLDSMYDSEDEMDFDALAKRKEAEENGVNLSELLTYEDDKETEENIIELDLSDPDLDNFRYLIDSCEDFEKLINALNISIKEQAIRERNIQYISRRIKNLVTKMTNKEIKECEKKDKPKKKNVKGGINEMFTISASLCKLLDYPKGAKKPWTTVTRDVWNYISENGLKDPDNNAMIIPNKELKKCLNIKKEKIRHLDVTSYLSPLLKGNKNKKKEDVMSLDGINDDDLDIGLDDDDINVEIDELDSDEELDDEPIVKPKSNKKKPIILSSDDESDDEIIVPKKTKSKSHKYKLKK